jgi:hypothetical protein
MNTRRALLLRSALRSRNTQSLLPSIKHAPITITREYSTRHRGRFSPRQPSITSRIFGLISGVLLLPIAILFSVMIRVGMFFARFAFNRMVGKEFKKFSDAINNADKMMRKELLEHSKTLDQQIASLMRSPHHTESFVTLQGLLVIDRHALVYDALFKKAKEAKEEFKKEQNLNDTIKEMYQQAFKKEDELEFDFTVMVDLHDVEQTIEAETSGAITCHQCFRIFITQREGEQNEYLLPFLIDLVATKRYTNDDYQLQHFVIRDEAKNEIVFEMRDGFEEELFDEDGERKRIQILDAEVKEK